MFGLGIDICDMDAFKGGITDNALETAELDFLDEKDYKN